jgi:hypothetical protein
MTHDSEEWGPWTEHDGKGVPADIRVGDICEIECENNDTGNLERGSAVVTPIHLSPHNWVWGESTHDTLRYRIRKPRALTQLREMIENLLAPKRERADT